MADMATLLEETIRGVRIVKAFTMERFEIGRFHDATKRHLSSNLKAQKIQALSSPVMELVTGFGMLALFLYAHRRIAAGTLTHRPAHQLHRRARRDVPADQETEQGQSLGQHRALGGRARLPHARHPERSRGQAERRDRSRAVGSGIRYENVSFRYEAEPVLRDVDLNDCAGRDRGASSAAAARGSRRSSIFCRASTTSTAAASPSTAATSAT